MSKTLFVWAQVEAVTPWADWWPELTKAMQWPADLVVERWQGAQSDFNWSRVFDSLNTFTLFRQPKVLVVFEAEKILKGIKKDELGTLGERLSRGPHPVVLVSSSEAAPQLNAKVWISPHQVEETRAHDKAAFRWIDFIHTQELTPSLSELDLALENGSHPLQLLQLLHRDFRLGRLIHYAVENRFREDEIATRLRLPPFAVRKWIQRSRLKQAQWAKMFDRLVDADLEMKSGLDATWAIRKLTLDLVGLLNGRSAAKSKARENSVSPALGLAAPEKGVVTKAATSLQLWPSTPQLWQVVPSFA